MTRRQHGEGGISDAGASAQGGARAARLLVVDDSPTIAELMSTVLAAAGHTVVSVRSGEDALRALETEGPFELALVDFAMPGMSGYALCRAIRRERRHARLAFVLVSARAGALGERFIEELGASAALAKPFEPRALVDLVARTLDLHGTLAHGRPSAPTAGELLEEDRLEVGSLTPPSEPHDEAVARLAAEIAHAVGPHLGVLRHTDLPPGRVLEDALLAGLADEARLARLASRLDALDLPLDTTTILRGNIAELPLAEILQTLALRRQSCVVRATNGSRRVVLALRDGSLDLAFARGLGRSFRLGRYLSRLGLLSREDVEDAVAECLGHSPLGEWLTRAGTLSQSELRRALVLQSSEIVYEALRWPRGRYLVTAEASWPEASRAKLGLGLAELVLEGIRRIDEWRVLDDALDPNRRVVLDGAALETVRAKLGPTEREAVSLADGVRTLRELVAATDQGAFEITAAVYRLARARVARLV